MSEKPKILVIGGGLAGCEVALQIAKAGFELTLIDMKPSSRSPAHSSEALAELVCSNSLRGADLSGACGLLKEELRVADSSLMKCADETAVPAGRALAVDREKFSATVEKSIVENPLIKVEQRLIDSVPDCDIAVVATGPLTQGRVLENLELGENTLSYHDAIAPLISHEGLDFEKLFFADRYDERGDRAAYLNCPINEEQYFSFVNALVEAKKIPLHDFETAPFFEGCLPVEEMAARGPMTLAHGPMKPVGLVDPKTGRRPFAVVQLRRENAAGTAYNIVGFQTRLTRPEQQRVLRTIPGLAEARIIRFGQVHRNTFVDAPRVLDEFMAVRSNGRIRMAGQITGVEGYVESIASGLYVGLTVSALLRGRKPFSPPLSTALGGLIGHTQKKGFYQPSNIVWAMIDTPPRSKNRTKREHRNDAAQKALDDISTWYGTISS